MLISQSLNCVWVLLRAASGNNSTRAVMRQSDREAKQDLFRFKYSTKVQFPFQFSNRNDLSRRQLYCYYKKVDRGLVKASLLCFPLQTRRRSSRRKRNASSRRWSRWWTWGTRWWRSWRRRGWRRWARSRRPSPSRRLSATPRRALRSTGRASFQTSWNFPRSQRWDWGNPLQRGDPPPGERLPPGLSHQDQEFGF